MIWIEVLVEGASDVPVVREILSRRFGLIEDRDFRIHPHQGKGRLPSNPLARCDPMRRQLLDLLPSKLRGYAKALPSTALVVVLVDVDNEPCVQVLKQLNDMFESLPYKPNTLFRLAIEETESWFLADLTALKAAFPVGLKAAQLQGIKPDSVVGAWECLAKALGVDPVKDATSARKRDWAEAIVPHLDLATPKSPSLAKFVEGIERYIQSVES